MKDQEKKLIVEISDEEIKSIVFGLNKKSDYDILVKKISKNTGVQKGKVIDISSITKVVGKDLNEIEKETKNIFRNVSVIVNQGEILCTNLTGFKRLNGSKVEKKDFDYILNEAKSSILKNQEKNSILHILNSNFILDKTKRNKIPLNIFGDHLSLHMTFLSLPKNDLKNINAIFDNNDLKINRVISKPLVCGLNLTNRKKGLKNFLMINFEHELSSVSLYEDSSLVFLKTFPFGTRSIYKDISQLCSLKKDEIEKIIKELDFNSPEDKKNRYLDKKFFQKSDFTKISIIHLRNIINTRIQEMIDYTFNKNNNLNYLENKFSHIYLFFEDQTICNGLAKIFEKSFNFDSNKISLESAVLKDHSALLGAAELIFKGWHKEAIPFVNKKKSIISSFFSQFFQN
tara:strand:+ start:2352 stop:3554 length:1203 start_codon:yes stop_codon:yes gene_type:complete